jgi:hypothetical protein
VGLRRLKTLDRLAMCVELTTSHLSNRLVDTRQKGLKRADVTAQHSRNGNRSFELLLHDFIHYQNHGAISS